MSNNRIKKSAVLRARCDTELKLDVQRIAAVNKLDEADLVRIACSKLVKEFNQKLESTGIVISV